MTDHFDTPANSFYPESLFKRIFEGARSQPGDLQLQDAERFWAWLGNFSVPEDATELGRRRSWLFYGSGVASILGLIGGIWLWQSTPEPSQPWHSFSAAHAQQTVVMLEDGSKLWLAAESRVDVRLGRKRRELRLVDGQALFEVAHDSHRPFTVQAGKGIVTAVGTMFNIKLVPRKTEVTVIKGVVDVGIPYPNAPEGATPIARIHRGDQISFSLEKNKNLSTVYVRRQSGTDLTKTTAWTRGKLIFSGEPLEEAISVVNSYAKNSLILKNPNLSSMPVYGVLDQGDVRGLLVLVNKKQPSALVLSK